ncbi:MAG: HD domain-containing phosphohydrolase [Dehalococcoidia bacterium]
MIGSRTISARRPLLPRLPVLPAAALLLTLSPIALLAWLRAHPAQNLRVTAPAQHFFIVTAVSLLALGVAGLVAVAALQIQQYRVLFLALGFMSMGGLFAVHAFATPGMVMPGMPGMPGMSDGHVAPAAGSGYSYDHGPIPAATAGNPSAGAGNADAGEYGAGAGAASVVGLSAFLSLLAPALLFGVSFTRLGKSFGWRIPFRPGAVVLVVAGALALYAAIAFSQTSLFLNSPLVTATSSHVIAVAGVVLFGFAAWRQALAFRATRLPLQGALVLAFLLLIQAQVAMATTQSWTLAWWSYHVLMLAAVTLALGALLYEYGAGRPLRRILEGALELRVEVGLEIDNVEAIAALAAATEAKDPDTRGHTARVAEISVAIGREMGLPHETLRTLARAGLLHDIGKIGIPDAVLLKPGPLDADGWETMKLHPQLGLDILERVGDLQREALILVAHHERMNGSGYPRGLVGEAIPFEARIISVADTYDAIVSDRPYRKGLPRLSALHILQEETGSHLYPPAVQAFMRIYDKGILAELVDGIYRAARSVEPRKIRKARHSAPSPSAIVEIADTAYWERRLAEECARAGRQPRPFVVVLMEVHPRDAWPELPAERAIDAIGRDLFHSLRGSDVIARVRHERYAILLPDTTPDVAYPICVRIVGLLRGQIDRATPMPEPPRVTFGIATHAPDCSLPAELIAAAERDLQARAARLTRPVGHPLHGERGEGSA